MIHTDGTPTIASSESTLVRQNRTPGILGEVLNFTAQTVLMERHSSGISVELVLVGGGLVIRVTEARGTSCERELVGIVPADKALDAFAHPYVYVTR
jgi:hypothetical protein